MDCISPPDRGSTVIVKQLLIDLKCIPFFFFLSFSISMSIIHYFDYKFRVRNFTVMSKIYHVSSKSLV